MSSEKPAIDLRPTIVAKSDQLNADDLIGGPITVTIARVTTKASSQDQPTSIHYEGDNGKPFKPCLVMRRLLVEMWGPDGAQYTGRRMVLFRDPTVKWGGAQVGGVRISHLSHIPADTMTTITETRGRKIPYKVLKLDDAPERQRAKAAKPASVSDVVHAISQAEDEATVNKYHASAMKRTHWTDEERTQIDKARTDQIALIAEAAQQAAIDGMDASEFAGDEQS